MKYYRIVSIGEEDLGKYILRGNFADITEIRLDLFSKNFIDQSLSIELKKIASPLLFTYRMSEDKAGAIDFFHTRGDFQKILFEFNSPNNFLDIELDKKNTILEYNNTLMYSLIYSIHNFERILTLSEMEGFIQSETKIYKFAVMPKNLEESFLFMESISKLSQRIPVIGICMGEFGRISRIFGDSFGSLATYLCFESPKAPEQIQFDKFLELRMEFSLKEKNWAEFEKLDSGIRVIT